MELEGCFAPGQAYVALSRATSLDTLLVKGLDSGVVFADEVYRSRPSCAADGTGHPVMCGVCMQGALAFHRKIRARRT